MQQNMSNYQARQRPCGVTLMSIFLLLQGIFMIVAGILGIFGLVVLLFDASRGGTLLLHGLTTFILGILSIIFSIGMFSLARWAFWAAVVIAAINLIDSAMILAQTHFASWGHIFNIAVSLLILLYFLLDANVRAAFRT